MIRFKTRASVSSFSVLATLLLATLMPVSAHEQKIVWHYGETCVMGEEDAGNSDASSYWAHAGPAQVVDIHELYDKHNRVVGLVYVTDKGLKTYQANWLMPLADIYRLQLHYDAWGWSDALPFDAARVGYPERECLSSHLTDGRTSNHIVWELQRKAYLQGRDFIVDPRSAWKDASMPVVIPGKDILDSDE